jgi:tRNA(Ile)-lysidine synthase
MRTQALVAPGDRVAIAVSGGADSVALAWLMHDLQASGEAAFSLAGVVHLNHCLRGAESDRDEAFVRALSERLGLAVDVARRDVAAAARAAHRSIEATAREARDAFFTDAALRLGASSVATAHTADDQAETVLLRLLRGSGARGAGGIRPRRGCLVRPLLDVRRAALRADLVARGEAWCEDSSNAERSIPRNAIRHDLLPAIERLAPGGVTALTRFAALARDDEAALEAAAIEAARKIVSFDGAAVRISRAWLARLAPAVARRVVRGALERVSVAGVAARHIDAIRAQAAADTSKGHLDLPGAAVDFTPEQAVLTPPAGRGRQRAEGGFDRPLLVPGSVEVPEAGVRLVAEVAETAGSRSWPNGRGPAAAVQGEGLQGGLRVRSRRPGDRLRPLGAPGRRKLQDVLVDRKVPRLDRDRVPIVVDDRGRIVWVAGYALAEEFRVTRPESGVVLLKIIDL